jgi:hypothetical protein
MAGCGAGQGALMRTLVSMGVLLMTGMALSQRVPPHAAAPWWQKETAMNNDGRLMLDSKPWWPRALALQDGQRFTLGIDGDGRTDAIVARVGQDIVEAIDDTGRAANIWNQISTTYVVSYNGTGKVDRMVSYIDSDHRGKADEVELRYYTDGYLRYAWFAKSYGGDAARIFTLQRWQYAGNDKGSEFRGNSQIYINKYDPLTHGWQPLSECPFSFWDVDDDGRTDVTLRVSATPTGSQHGPDTDYANNYNYMWSKEATPLNKMAATNMRLSFNVDARPRMDPLDHPHSNFSFTMTGDQPYDYPGMRDFNDARRFPQTTVHMPWKAKWFPGLRYPSNSTGFTWDEARSNFRWEGQFWIYERDYMSNTGSPTQRWNMRREFTAKPQKGPRLYFSAADQRFHMRGAQQAWMEAGHVVDETKDLEFRWWSSRNDGYLDTVEVYRGDDVSPARVAHFDPHATSAALDVGTLSRDYNGKVLPSAIAADEAILRALHALVNDATASKYEQAASAADSLERKRYCLDIARELLYLRVRDLLQQREARNPYNSSPVDVKRFRDPAPGDTAHGYTLGDTLSFWDNVQLLHALDQAYAAGDFQAVTQMLGKVKRDGGVRHDAQ